MPHTLLVADDSVTVRRVIELTFADEGVTVVSASDGDQALAMIEAAPPDTVLVDVALPNRNGYEVASFVKARPGLAHIPVVLLTAAHEPVDEARAEEAGCRGTLAKPFEPQEVIARVRELLGAPAPPEFEAAVASAPPATDGPLPTVAEVEPASVNDLDAYFDRLDSAFASLPVARPRVEAPVPTSDSDPASRGAASTPGSVYALPALADVFAALLAAEQRQADPVATSPWRGPGGSAADDDALVERVAARAVAQLSEDAVRSRAADILFEVADRLVREEIERIRMTIR